MATFCHAYPGLIEICGPPASGKTTLSHLLFLHILEVAKTRDPSKRIEVYWGTRWIPQEIAQREDLTGHTHLGNRRLHKVVPEWRYPEAGVTSYLILDEGQTTYWDEGFWLDFVKEV